MAIIVALFVLIVSSMQLQSVDDLYPDKIAKTRLENMARVL